MCRESYGVWAYTGGGTNENSIIGRESHGNGRNNLKERIAELPI